MTERYLEDFAIGQAFGSGKIRIDKERVKEFAAEFDPQPFHLDDETARSTIFHGLAVKVRATTLNQDGKAVQILIANLVVPRRK